MFTAEQVIAAHSKVKSGADFPKYIQEIKELGVTHYEVFVADGRSYYYGKNDHAVTVAPKYSTMKVNSEVNKELFIKELKAHQAGKTDYPTFIKMCADTGIHKWEIRMDEMTCTYFDQLDNQLLIEVIPS